MNTPESNVDPSSTQWRTTAATYLALTTVLVLYPGFRMAVAYLDLFPGQAGVDNWWSLWTVVLVGHWVIAAIVLAAIRSEGGGLASIGLGTALFLRRRGWFVAILIAAGLAAYFTPQYFYGDTLPEQMRSHPLGPITSGQRLFWIAMALTAGFVEEFAYRGYAITRLRKFTGLPVAIAVSIAAFALMHGPSAFNPQFLVLYLFSGAVFSLVFVWMKMRRLELLIIAHTAIDLALVAAP